MSSLVPADITDIVTIIADGIGGDQTTAILAIYIVAHQTRVILLFVGIKTMDNHDRDTYIITYYFYNFSNINKILGRQSFCLGVLIKYSIVHLLFYNIQVLNTSDLLTKLD